jgi:hypothetical protein
MHTALKKTLMSIAAITTGLGIIAVTLGPPILILWVIFHFVSKFW